MKRLSVIACAAVAFTGPFAVGQTTSWTNASGGSANLSTNWSAGVPTQNASARFDLPGPYTISFAASLQASLLDVSTGEVTLDLNRQTFAIGSGVNIGPLTTTFPPGAGAALVVQGGRLTTSNLLTVGRPSIAGTLSIRGGGIVETSSIRFENNSFTSVVGAGSALSFGSVQSATTPIGAGPQMLVTDGAIVAQSSTSSSPVNSLASLTVRGLGSRVRNLHAGVIRLEAGASADYGLLTATDLVADQSSVSANEVYIGTGVSGSSSPPGRLLLRGSTLSITGGGSQPIRVYGGGTFELDDGTVQGLRTTSNEGIVRGSGRFHGHLENLPTGTVLVGPGQRLSFEGRSSMANHNRGLINVIGGELAFGGQVNNINTSVPNNGGRIIGRDATLHFGDGSLPFALRQNSGASLALTGGVNDVYGYIDNGSLAKVTHTGDSTTFYYGHVANHGTIQTAAGSTATFLGAVSGSGTFSGPGAVAFEGTVEPGNSPGLMRFAGDVTFGQESTLVLELAGTARGTQYDAIDVAGELTFHGTVRVERLDGFTPLPGQQFDFVHAGSFVGTPTFVNATGLPGLAFDTDFAAAGGLSIDLRATPGDANLDDAVNFDDLLVLAQHYNAPGSQTWLTGDFTADAAVGFDDLLALAQHYGQSSLAADWALAQSLVPEPTAMTALGLVGVVAFARRRRGGR